VTKISQNGVYDIDMDTYHSDCCDGPSISAVGLKKLLSVCPAKYWGTSYLNPRRFPEKKSKALDVGKAAHALVLGEPDFAASFVVCPHDNLNKNPGRAWNEEWKARVESGVEKRTLVRADDFETIKAMAEAIKKSPQCARAFVDGKPERSLIWRDPETGVWLKSRPDLLPDNPAERLTPNYKTTLNLHPEKFDMQAWTLGYEIGAALEWDSIKQVLGVDPIGVAHIVQEKDPPYLAECRIFPPEAIEQGRREYRAALRIFADCWERHIAGKPEIVAWPGYTTEATYIGTPYKFALKMGDTYYGEDTDSPGAGVDYSAVA
jgi:hypothetical protein